MKWNDDGVEELQSSLSTPGVGGGRHPPGNGEGQGGAAARNARLSPRSMVYTVTFMLAGFLTATLAHSTCQAAAPPSPPQLPLPHSIW